MKVKLLKSLLLFIFIISISSFASTKRCYITFSSKGGDGTMVKQECQKGATIKLNPCTYTKDGYYFSYWEDDFGKTYKDQEYITIDKDIYLHATWAKVGDANDPEIKAKNQDDKIIEEIINYQKLRNMDYIIYPNKWYTTGTNLWYYIDENLKPKKGWIEETITERTTRNNDVSTPSTIINTGETKIIVAPSDINADIISIPPDKRISTNVKIDEDKIKFDKSRWYYLDTDTCLLSIGWKVIDNKYYYFATETIDADYVYDKLSGLFVPNGKDKVLGQMYCDEYTPDGRYVNSQGVMVNQYR